MNELTRTAPQRVFLQISDDEANYNDPWPAESEYSGDITWCSESALACEVEYTREDLLARAMDSVDFYRRRCEALQKAQNHMRDPERKMVCDILANGETYVTPNTKIQRAR